MTLSTNPASQVCYSISPVHHPKICGPDWGCFSHVNHHTATDPLAPLVEYLAGTAHGEHADSLATCLWKNSHETLENCNFQRENRRKTHPNPIVNVGCSGPGFLEDLSREVSLWLLGAPKPPNFLVKMTSFGASAGPKLWENFIFQVEESSQKHGFHGSSHPVYPISAHIKK